jgi:hypothetical protein
MRPKWSLLRFPTLLSRGVVPRPISPARPVPLELPSLSRVRREPRRREAKRQAPEEIKRQG